MEKIPQQKTFDGLKIVLYGPESTGKSTLACELAQYYDTAYVEEFSRAYLQPLYDATEHICTFEDILPIVKGQIIAENQAVYKANTYLFCDTDPLETWVYSQYYFGKSQQLLDDVITASHYDLYLLMDIDVPWVKDDLRDRPDSRKELFNLFKKGLEQFNKPYKTITGLNEDRLKNAVEIIDNLVL